MLTLEQLARAMGGTVSGDQVIAPGPGHSKKDRSLSIKLEESAPEGFLVHSFSGDDARVCKSYVREKLKLPGLTKSVTGPSKPQTEWDADKRSEIALSIWRAAIPAQGTLVETYLMSRGIRPPVPPALRFHPELKHREGGKWPAMVALVTRGIDDKALAIHRTFLARDGDGKARVQPQKMMLGPCRAGAVRLAPVSDRLMVGEGIETCLSAMQATGLPAWVALSTSGLMSLDFPPEVQHVIVLEDGEQAGQNAARKAASRWKREGRRVRIAQPTKGMDFNDMLMGRAPKSKGTCDE